MGDKGDKSAARPPEGSLVETMSLIKGPKSAIVPFADFGTHENINEHLNCKD